MTTKDEYKLGILDVCDSLVTDMIKFLKEEGRYKYRMIGYVKEITKFFESFYDNQTDEDIENYERILYQLSKSIKIDYSRLRVRKLSPADSVICIILKLLGFMSEEMVGEVRSLFQKFHDNIKNRAKNDKLSRIEDSVSRSLEDLTLGKLKLSDIDLYSVEHPKPKVYEGDGELHEWGKTDGKEIEL